MKLWVRNSLGGEGTLVPAYEIFQYRKNDIIGNSLIFIERLEPILSRNQLFGNYIMKKIVSSNSYLQKSENIIQKLFPNFVQRISNGGILWKKRNGFEPTNRQDPVPRRRRARTEQGDKGLVLESWAGERKKGLSVNSDEILGHGKESLKKELLLLLHYIYYINQNSAWKFSEWVKKKI